MNVFVFAFSIKPTCRLTEDHFRNRHSSVTWRKRNLFAHRFFAQEEVVDDEEEVLPRGHDHGGAGETLSTALTTRSPPSRPKFSAGELLKCSGAAAGDGSMEPGCAFPAFYKKATAGPAADWGLYSYKSRDLGQIWKRRFSPPCCGLQGDCNTHIALGQENMSITQK